MKYKQITPRALTDTILDIGVKIVGHKDWRLLAVESDSDDYNQCHTLVDYKVEDCGGKNIFGWYLTEQSICGEVFSYQAIFHSIWEAPDGSWHDITPDQVDDDRLFIADHKRKYVDGNGYPSKYFRQSNDSRLLRATAHIEAAERLLCRYRVGFPIVGLDKLVHDWNVLRHSDLLQQFFNSRIMRRQRRLKAA